MIRPNQGAKGRPVADPTAPMIDKFEEQRLSDARLIKGIFQDNEVKNGSLHFFFHKWKGDPISEYKLVDGQEYELPLAVVKHLNSGCYYTKDEYIPGLSDAFGRPLKNPNPKKIHRFSFKVSEYI